MATNYIAQGDVIDWVATGAKSAGAGCLVGVRVGVAIADIASGATGAVAMEGVFQLPKLSADVVAQGALVYWDNTNSRLTITSAGNTLAGYAVEAAGPGVTTCKVKINA